MRLSSDGTLIGLWCEEAGMSSLERIALGLLSLIALIAWCRWCGSQEDQKKGEPPRRRRKQNQAGNLA